MLVGILITGFCTLGVMHVLTSVVSFFSMKGKLARLEREFPNGN